MEGFFQCLRGHGRTLVGIWARRLPLFMLAKVLLLGGGLLVNAQAAEQYLLTPSTYESLSAVHKLMDKQQYTSALKQLTALQDEVNGKAYEQAVVLQTLGYVYSSLEKYPKAIQAFKASLALDALPARVTHDLRYGLAQLYMATEQYGKALQLLEAWFKAAESPPAEAHVLAASAYYHLKRYAEVIPHIEVAIELAQAPQEEWYQLHLAARLELKQYSQAAQILETLIGHFPNKEQYWKQLGAVYMEMNKEHRALAVEALVAHMEPLDSKSLIHLANLYRYLHIPYKAAQVLQQGLRDETIQTSSKHWEFLADAWLAAREWERAAAAFKEAGRLRQDGKMALRRGQVLIELQDWKQAEKAFAQSLRKGGLDDPGQARFFLSQARYEQGHFAEAIQALKLIQASSAYSKQAAQWLKHLQVVRKQGADGKG
ncbi:TPR repeat protein [Nitrosococcus oceani ATCC 19707]|uniref:TPR repeat protein n=1 Tax=Nitrosococcus oceani (strain ATCC 19707 / BCRC 17464 / JCM 30415 / NCIMB 11848 / C-107) TaxID=323261 RepID=Q3JDG6_NITOC|nr:tetratricopeptide repeat protein [Nitrosococcus oceani]ABA57130.1 TPR repeat protein [Nitrosococcus oceani ATCC 19707]